MSGRWTIAGLLQVAACETQHSFAIRNQLGAAIDVHVEAGWSLEVGDCRRARLGEGTVIDQTIAPAAERCFSGPVVGPGDDYEVLDDVGVLRLARGAATCLEGDGPSLRDRFAREQDTYVLAVDELACPDRRPGATLRRERVVRKMTALSKMAQGQADFRHRQPPDHSAFSRLASTLFRSAMVHGLLPATSWFFAMIPSRDSP